MKTYYGQMTKEQLIGTKIVVKDCDHNIAFQEMVFSAGCKWIVGDFGQNKNEKLLVVDEGGYLGFSSSTGWFAECEYTEINWLPESERPSSCLKSQLAEAIAKRDKRKAKLQKAADKLEQAEKEFHRLIAEMENEVESIGGISCKIAEMTKPDIPEGVDVDDPTTWQKGDIVECLHVGGDECFKVGYEYLVFNAETISRYMGIGYESCDIVARNSKFRFVRRP